MTDSNNEAFDENNEIHTVEQENDKIQISRSIMDDIVNFHKNTTENLLSSAGNRNSNDLNLPNQNVTSRGNDMIKVICPISSDTNVPPYTPPIQDQVEASPISSITTDRIQQPIPREKHVMISYKHGPTGEICRKLYERLITNNYKVWFDESDFVIGNLYRTLGEAIDNAYVVLACINEEYSKSEYCIGEFVYAKVAEVPVIPCIMSEGYKPRGGLGFIRSDLNSIDLFDETKLDENFNQLTKAINCYRTNSNIEPISTNSMNFRERFKLIINAHITSIKNWYLRQGNIDDQELSVFIHKLLQEFSPETLQTIQNNDEQTTNGNSDFLVQNYLDRDSNLAELIRVHQENYIQIRQYLLGHDQRLMAIERLLSQDRQENLRMNLNEYMQSIHRVDSSLRQGQERSNFLIEKLTERIEQMEELLLFQQQQITTLIESSQQMMNQSMEINERLTTTDHQQDTLFSQRFAFSFDTFLKLSYTIVLLYGLKVLLTLNNNNNNR